MDNCTTLVRKIQPQDYDIFMGMDVDKSSIVLMQLNHLGIEKLLQMPYNSTKLLHYVANHLPGKRVAFVYEAGPTGFGLSDALTTAGYPCLVVNPAMVPTMKGKRVRTNRLDARKLAYQLRGGELQGVHVPSTSYRHLREYVTLRKMHMLESAKCKQRLKALYLRHGLPWPSTRAGDWSNAVLQHLNAYAGDFVLQFKIRSLLESLQFSRRQALKAQQAMRQFVEATPELTDSTRYAMSLPGIGWIVATYAIARLGDWRELGTSDQTASFFGLVQTEDSTGDSSTRGSITKTGDPVMRSLLIEAAWVAIRKDPELATFYHRVSRAHAKDKAAQIAIVAVARKLTTRLHCVLKERRLYQLKTAGTDAC